MMEVSGWTEKHLAELRELWALAQRLEQYIRATHELATEPSKAPLLIEGSV